MQKLVLVSALLVLLGCGKPSPELQGIDLVQWKEDKFACKGIRASSEANFFSQKDELRGLSEADIIKLLGRPDQNELYKRNQKFFHYFISAAPECDSTIKTSKRMTIRFNAMGFAKEVAIE
jgi:hypothetical protein